MNVTEHVVYSQLFIPLCRLVLTMSFGLLVASLLEALHWTRVVARVAAPVAKAGRLSAISASSFTMAFFSPAASNTLLAEAHRDGRISRQELVLSNLLNSSPSFFVHLPTVFSTAFAFLGQQAFVYVGLTFLAATIRSLATIALGRMLLIPTNQTADEHIQKTFERRNWKKIAAIAFARYKKRLGKLLVFTIPIYCLFFILHHQGVFQQAERWFAAHLGWMSFLSPQAISIVVLSIVAESGAALSAAASISHSGVLTSAEMITALLVGNIFSTPVRAVRHQFPAYAGYYRPALAGQLILLNQFSRILSLSLVTLLYYLCMH